MPQLVDGEFVGCRYVTVIVFQSSHSVIQFRDLVRASLLSVGLLLLLPTAGALSHNHLYQQRTMLNDTYGFWFLLTISTWGQSGWTVPFYSRTWHRSLLHGRPCWPGVWLPFLCDSASLMCYSTPLMLGVRSKGASQLIVYRPLCLTTELRVKMTK